MSETCRFCTGQPGVMTRAALRGFPALLDRNLAAWAWYVFSSTQVVACDCDRVYS
jgi:hypothetical protein